MDHLSTPTNPPGDGDGLVNPRIPSWQEVPPNPPSVFAVTPGIGGTSAVPMAEPKKVIGPRLTIVESVYHSNANSGPTSTQHRYDRILKSDEQVYRRRLKATTLWAGLDTGWIEPDQCGMLHIHNEGEMPLFLVFDLCLSEGDSWKRQAIIVSPRETLRMQVADVSMLQIRCEEGVVKFLLTLVPA